VGPQCCQERKILAPARPPSSKSKAMLACTYPRKKKLLWLFPSLSLPPSLPHWHPALMKGERSATGSASEPVRFKLTPAMNYANNQWR
jgi:hypothetical protein